MSISNSFSVMCYNVAGLPGFLSSGDPSTYSVDMGKRIGGWDIVNVQEDFNYHAALYSQNSHEYRTPTSGGVPFGSGLNTLSHLPFSSMNGLERVKWKECSNFESADCMTPKGFTFVEVILADGVSIDVYNVHTDAGSKEADLKARASNLAQLGDYISDRSAGNAVIVMGDTNTRYTREHDTIREFAENARLTDGWVEFVRNGTPPEKGAPALSCNNDTMSNECEVVDKILYRGNNYIKLKLDKWNNENAAFLGSNGTPLSDHPPISSTFSWSLNPVLSLGKAVGGPHGNRFSDLGSVVEGQTIRSITLRFGKRCHGIELKISAPTEQTFTHGGSGGDLNTLNLSEGEYITSMEAHWGKRKGRTRIFHLSFTTNTGKSVSGGSTTDEKMTMTAPEGFQLGGFHGRDGDEIDLLGPIWTKIAEDSATQQEQYSPGTVVPATPEEPIQLSESFGGPHGTTFSDRNLVSAGQTIGSITLYTGERCHGLELEITAPTAQKLTHGGSGGTLKTLILSPDEYITSMEVHWGKHKGRTRVFYLGFTTSAGNSVDGGTTRADKQTVTAPKGYQLGGFFGLQGDEIDSIGAIWTKIAA
ncbi:Endonuclease [Phytophthora megakarya]|uniref:Endonuclease n=1 Tax=Phytophthora megakarya TaxID=4795 RepID=A0A225X3D2_9STRA|nr:Endonuclease [Phytophthora megakarya]